MPQYPKVAIVGGGPAGLVAAIILRRHGWSVTVFESDASPTVRDQGGTLDLHPEEGQLALQKAGLLDAFMAVARHEDQEQRLVDHATGAVLREEIPEPGTGDRPEIDRVLLRQILLEPLEDRVVCWGKRVLDVIACSGGHHLRLQGSVEGPFDLVIGADGAWSRVRTALTDVRPAYCGVTFVELWLTAADERHAASARLVGHGSMFSLHGGAGIIAQHNGGGTIRVYAAFRTTPEETDRPDKTLAGITTADLLARFAGWAKPLRDLIAQADCIAAVRPIVALPTGLRWSHRRGLTLVGDAAHVMPPLGVGVNLAMLDAANLAEALVGSGDWCQAVQDYEAVMMDRAAECAERCDEGFEEMFSDKRDVVAMGHLRAVGEELAVSV